MTATLDAIVAPLRKSPLYAEIADLLHAELTAERALRQKFYAEITPEQKVEFIGGEIIMHSPARNLHLDITLNASQLLATFVRRHQLGEVKVEKCLLAFPRNDYEPDLVFFGLEKAKTLQPGTMRFPCPDLIIEVLSPSTEDRDRGIKFEDYAAHGVSEYWIIDPDQQIIEQYLLQNSTYRLTTKSSTGLIHSTAIPGFTAPIPAFFHLNENLAALKTILNH